MTYQSSRDKSVKPGLDHMCAVYSAGLSVTAAVTSVHQNTGALLSLWAGLMHAALA